MTFSNFSQFQKALVRIYVTLLGILISRSSATHKSIYSNFFYTVRNCNRCNGGYDKGISPNLLYLSAGTVIGYQTPPLTVNSFFAALICLYWKYSLQYDDYDKNNMVLFLICFNIPALFNLLLPIPILLLLHYSLFYHEIPSKSMLNYSIVLLRSTRDWFRL